ncbi:HPr family phosphocarrier protein [Alicyclobacillus sp. SO9]|uniref:HPr family phosphocarrier protein n=1 Tax=Alicyclobacillus sp. SO9 TaxID=2665646 RepID=UPI0018E8A07D|nr:HPr family phosphocarrier protein [Alicyclobacillus sp. SO9]QQE77592.1 HPr family phosphocarrier protein [Alicyclobacillus sp. SO9]
MTEKTVRISNPTGLHARPAAEFVREAGNYSSQIYIKKADKQVDAKSILGVMSLSVRQGDEITITADGSDETQAVDNLTKVLSALEG